jgi:hypothetical protein
VKKTIAISFLFIFLCANTEIGQLLKLPNLIQHFFEHDDHKDDHIVSFIDFVKSHYNDNKQHSDKDEHDNHQNLPFKTINGSVNSFLAFEDQTAFSFDKPNTISVVNKVPFPQEFYISSFYASIWLPPKLS